ncbi:MAG: hypothetical protein R3B46_02320 [Phycisphaerales bacterium]
MPPRLRRQEVRVVSRDWQQVKQELLYRITNMGQPFIFVVDANYTNRGELYPAHQWNGLDIEVAKAAQVLATSASCGGASRPPPGAHR